jgi:tRNA pseudouridine55 synthase
MPLYIYKNIGETPLELINNIKSKHNDNDNKNNKYSYAGRLDPMARGEMIILKGLECKNRNQYLNLDKEYEFEILLGYQSDTFDVLGKIQNTFLENIPEILNFNLTNYLGIQEQYYPPYSSIVVNKKPLWLWSKENRLDEIEIPKRNINIYSLEYLGKYEIQNNLELFELIKNKIYKLQPNNFENFRVKEIIDEWEKVLICKNNIDKNIKINNKINNKLKIYKFRSRVSSGTYIRSLVNRIGMDLGYYGIAFDIHRTKFL